MPDPRWVGMVVSGSAVRVVDVRVPGTGPLVIENEESFSLQEGERSEAYAAMHRRIVNYLQEHKIARVLVKESAVPPPPNNRATKALLESAEFRGVVLAAASTVCAVSTAARATISRTFGQRGADAYLKDNAFWAKETQGLKTKGSREAVLLVLAEVRKATKSKKKGPP